VPAVVVGSVGLGNRNSVSAYSDGSTGKTSTWVSRTGPVTCEDAVAAVATNMLH
jgi:hypothetical protein